MGVSACHLTAIRLHAVVVFGRPVLTILTQRADTISVRGRNALSSLPSLPPRQPLFLYPHPLLSLRIALCKTQNKKTRSNLRTLRQSGRSETMRFQLALTLRLSTKRTSGLSRFLQTSVPNLANERGSTESDIYMSFSIKHH